ncbi:replication initiator [Actinopolymorpha sp. NPDC004070]|uniref:replication initiator n=1 Tax=Actinopolymorpha sp. NPDC004070 TaxID=3154548 RepID=UPI0033AB3DAC
MSPRTAPLRRPQGGRAAPRQGRLDTSTGESTRVAIPCGSTLASRCPTCADKARKLRIQQCGRTFTGRDGKTWRPSMVVTLTPGFGWGRQCSRGDDLPTRDQRA